MSAQIRLPNITGATLPEQVTQMRSYLYQLVNELQWVLDTMETGGTSTQGSLTIAQSSDDILQTVRAGDNKTLQSAKNYTNSAINAAITEALEASY